MKKEDSDRLVEICSGVLQEIPSLTEAVKTWGEPLHLFESQRRNYSAYFGKTGMQEHARGDELLRAIELLSIMSQPALVQNFIDAEQRGIIKLNGNQLQLLNNAYYHMPWEFCVFVCEKHIASGLYLGSRLFGRGSFYVYSPELEKMALADSVLLAACFVPVSVPDNPHPPTYAIAGPIAKFETFESGAMERILQRLFRLPIGFQPDKQQLGELQLAAAPAVAALSVFGARNAFLSEDEVDALLCSSRRSVASENLDKCIEILRLWFGNRRDGSIEYFEALFGEEHFGTEVAEGGSSMDAGSGASRIIGGSGQNTTSQLIQIFIDTTSKEAEIRTTGLESFRLACLLLEFAAAGQFVELTTLPRVQAILGMPTDYHPTVFLSPRILTQLDIDAGSVDVCREPDFTMGLIPALAARDILDQELPGPDRGVLERLELDW